MITIIYLGSEYVHRVVALENGKQKKEKYASNHFFSYTIFEQRENKFQVFK
jgi:hypothetical protein